MRDLPLIASILRALAAGAPVSRETILAGLRAQVPPPEAERQVDTAVDWGRWAELLRLRRGRRLLPPGGGRGMSLPPLLLSLLDEAVDVAIVTVTVFVLLRMLRSSRARLALVGMSVVGLVDLAARQIGLPLTAWFFQGLFLVSAVVLVLAFQDDLKRFFERLAVLGLGRRSPPPRRVRSRPSCARASASPRRAGAP